MPVLFCHFFGCFLEAGVCQILCFSWAIGLLGQRLWTSLVNNLTDCSLSSSPKPSRWRFYILFWGSAVTTGSVFLTISALSMGFGCFKGVPGLGFGTVMKEAAVAPTLRVLKKGTASALCLNTTCILLKPIGRLLLKVFLTVSTSIAREET